MRLASAGLALIAIFVASTPVQAVPQFTDWTTVDTVGETGAGTLGGISVSISGGNITAGVTNGTFAGFSNGAFFTPALALTDMVEVTGSFLILPSYTITFGAAITDPIIDVASLGSVLTFTLPAGVTLSKVSGNFAVSGNTVTGDVVDQNGTIQLNGTLTSFSFTAHALALFNNDLDGIDIQIGAPFAAVPEPGTLALVALGALGTLVARRWTD